MNLNTSLPKYIHETSSHIKIDDTKSTFSQIHQIPSTVSKGWLNFFIFSSRQFLFSLKIKPINSHNFIQKLDMKRNAIISSNNWNINHAIDVTVEEIDEIKLQLSLGEQKVFGINMIYESTPRSTKGIKLDMESHNIISSIEYLSQKETFLQLMGFKTSSKSKTYDLTTLSFLLSFQLKHLKSGSLYSVNKIDNTLVILNRFLLNNHNGIIFGTSGSGKSYNAKLEIIKLYMEGVDIWVIDPEEEYKTLTQKLNGEYINLNTSVTTPMGIITTKNRTELINIYYSFICALIKIKDSSILEYAIEQALNQSNFSLNVIYDLLPQNEEGNNIKIILHRYVHGTYKNIFNFDSFNPTKQLTVFNIQQIPQDLKDIYMLFLSTCIWIKVLNNKKKFMLFIDEAWLLLRNEYMGEFINSLTKRIRKYNGGITFITQDINDFLLSHYGKTILSNCAYKLILKQEISSINLISHVLHLTNDEKKFLNIVSKGEGIMSIESMRFPCKLFVTSFEKELIS